MLDDNDGVHWFVVRTAGVCCKCWINRCRGWLAGGDRELVCCSHRRCDCRCPSGKQRARQRSHCFFFLLSLSLSSFFPFLASYIAQHRAYRAAKTTQLLLLGAAVGGLSSPFAFTVQPASQWADVFCHAGSTGARVKSEMLFISPEDGCTCTAVRAAAAPMLSGLLGPVVRAINAKPQ